MTKTPVANPHSVVFDVAPEQIVTLELELADARERINP